MELPLSQYYESHNYDLSRISPIYAREIFVNAVKEYFEKKISESLLASIAGDLMYQHKMTDKIIENDVNLGHILTFVSELDWFKANQKVSYDSTLKELKKFFELNEKYQSPSSGTKLLPE